MTVHSPKPLTDAQQHMLRMTTRGTAKDSPRLRQQIVKPRAENQRFQRREVACIRCLEPRDPWSYPVCPRCTGEAT